MGVGAEEAHGHVAVRGGLDGARAEPARGVGVDEQGEHHRGRILFAARAALVDAEVGGGDLLHGFEHQMDDVIGGQPFAQIAGQQHRRLPIQIDKTCRHTELDPYRAFLFNLFLQICQRRGKSDRLLAVIQTTLSWMLFAVVERLSLLRRI